MNSLPIDHVGICLFTLGSVALYVSGWHPADEEPMPGWCLRWLCLPGFILGFAGWMNM